MQITDAGIPLHSRNLCMLNHNMAPCCEPHTAGLHQDLFMINKAMQVRTNLLMQGMPLQAVLVQVREAVGEGPEGQRLRLDRLALFKHLPRLCHRW